MFGKEATPQTHGIDMYTHTIGDVILPEDMNLNQELVKQGWWWSRKHATGCAVPSSGPVPDWMRRSGGGKLMSGEPAHRIMAMIRSPGGTASVYPLTSCNTLYSRYA